METIEDAVEEKVGVVSIENSSTDSQFLCSKVENILPEEEEKKQFIKAEIPNTVNATEHSTDTKKTKTESNDAPRPKRKYKKRAVKEKQIFECEICHYKCRHECELPQKFDGQLEIQSQLSLSLCRSLATPQTNSSQSKILYLSYVRERIQFIY